MSTDVNQDKNKQSDEDKNKQSDEPKKPKHDLSTTRQAIGEAIALDEVKTNLKVNLQMKPNKKVGFVQSLYSKRVELICLHGRDPHGNVELYPTFFGDKSLYKDFPEKKLVHFVPIITTFQQFGYWQLKQPMSGRVMGWHTTGKAAAQVAETRWTQIYADNIAKAYVLVHPADPHIFDNVEPEWPQKFLDDPEAYLIKALEEEDLIIDDPENELLLRMDGKII